jgi:hypothetical protein
LDCGDCHDYSLGRNLQRLSAHLNGRVPEQPRLGGTDIPALIERCRSCHQQQYADWKAGPHSATYSRIFTDAEHNRKRRLRDDCLRCHGMHFEGSIQDVAAPLDTRGPWKLAKPELADQPTIPCIACHSIHRFGEPSTKPEARSGGRQAKVRPSLALYDRRSRTHIQSEQLPIPMVLDGARPVKASPDPRQGVCYQCHAPEASRVIGSGDDRTPMGVHEGLSCYACHQGHQQNTRASCANCHPRLSNCGLDVEKMDTTFASSKSRRDIHTVKCIDCHPSGIPRRRQEFKP